MDSVSEALPSGASGSAFPVTGAAPQSEHLIDLYNRYFEVVLADTPDLLKEAYRLRYQVYCVENPFENPDEHSDGCERDEYDGHSVHSLLVHRPTGSVAGTVRLVLPQRGKPLPITRVCRHPLLGNLRVMPAESTAEISRFAVSKQFRRRATDRICADYALVERPPVGDGHDRRVFPHITLGLMKAIVQMSWRHGTTHWSAVMDPALLRLIGRIGLNFEPLGPLVDYHGVRQPCHGEASEVLAGLRHQRLDAWELITDSGRYWGGADVQRKFAMAPTP